MFADYSSNSERAPGAGTAPGKPHSRTGTGHCHRRRAAKMAMSSRMVRNPLVQEFPTRFKADLGYIPAVLGVKYCADGTEVSSP